MLLYVIRLIPYFPNTALISVFLFKPASHCPDVDSRWTHEYGILNFVRSWPRTWKTVNKQPKQVRCLQKVTRCIQKATRWHSKHTRRHFKYAGFLPEGHTNAHEGHTKAHECTRMPHEGYTNATRRRIESTIRSKLDHEVIT